MARNLVRAGSEFWAKGYPRPVSFRLRVHFLREPSRMQMRQLPTCPLADCRQCLLKSAPHAYFCVFMGLPVRARYANSQVPLGATLSMRSAWNLYDNKYMWSELFLWILIIREGNAFNDYLMNVSKCFPYSEMWIRSAFTTYRELANCLWKVMN